MNSSAWRSLSSIFLLSVTLVLFSCRAGDRKDHSGGISDQNVQSSTTIQPERWTAPEKIQNRIPPKVYEVLAYIRKHNRAPQGHVGGKKFGNYEKLLPIKKANGGLMYYREWDVYPKRKGINRGKERIVTSDDERAWYTNDHYRSFVEIK
jgi:ribonuclease T1